MIGCPPVPFQLSAHAYLRSLDGLLCHSKHCPSLFNGSVSAQVATNTALSCCSVDSSKQIPARLLSLTSCYPFWGSNQRGN